VCHDAVPSGRSLRCAVLNLVATDFQPVACTCLFYCRTLSWDSCRALYVAVVLFDMDYFVIEILLSISATAF